jgi:hypothetical protein
MRVGMVIGGQKLPSPLFQEDILREPLILQQRAASEETSDNTQLQTTFAVEGPNLPSLNYSTPIDYSLPQVCMCPCLHQLTPYPLSPFPTEASPSRHRTFGSGRSAGVGWVEGEGWGGVAVAISTLA